MGVVEFSADAWQASSPGLRGGLARRMEAVSELAQGLQALAGSERISGQGADAMRAYIREVHGPILQSLLIGLSTFQTAIGVYWNGYAQVDAGGNFRLVRDELEAHLSQLESGMGALRGIAAELRKISGDASHLVSLGGAGASAAERCVDDLDRMHAIAKDQVEAWEAYEASDHGFGQVKALIAELNRIVNNVGAVTVGQGRTYTPGSFRLTLQGLGALTSGMVEYCQQNQGAASKGWETAFTGFQKDLEAAEKARREQAGWDLIWDGLQIVAGVVVAAIGLGLTPFTGGVSIGLTVLGGTLLVGGTNNAVNHYSIATTGQEFNLMDMAATWVDVNLAQPIAAFGPVGQFVGGVVSGTGHVLTGFGQLSVKDAAVGVSVLVTDQAARDALWNQLTNTGAQVLSCDWYVAGQTAAELGSLAIPGVGAVKVIRTASLAAKTAKVAAAASRALSGIRGVSVAGDKVLINGVEKMTAKEWGAIRDASVHNTSSSEVTLGKWKGPDNPETYFNQAIKSGNEYFNLGNAWDDVRAAHGLSERDMFDLFNRPFLDDVIREGKTVRFTHDPRTKPGALRDELDYLKNNGYVFDPATMTARKEW
ncbi:T7SS effector LXG polymorphic toxin [Leifsonia xyli]|uniref:T7SS effector LXG polymorphic toxin n=1 Tax=Leifsonia xyli TaxID=1575 RepID=UPI003D672693